MRSRRLGAQHFLLLVLILFLLLFLAVIYNVLEALSSVDHDKVSQANILHHRVMDVEDCDIEHPLEHGLQWDQLLQGSGLVKFQRFKARRLGID